MDRSEQMSRFLRSLIPTSLSTSCSALSCFALCCIAPSCITVLLGPQFLTPQCASAQERTGVQPSQLPQPIPQSVPTPPALAPTISGKTLDELETLLKAARVELGQRLAKEDQANAGKPETPPASLLDDPVRDGEKRFLELEAIIKERRSQRETELLKSPKGTLKDPLGSPQKQPEQIGPTKHLRRRKRFNKI